MAQKTPKAKLPKSLYNELELDPEKVTRYILTLWYLTSNNDPFGRLVSEEFLLYDSDKKTSKKVIEQTRQVLSKIQDLYLLISNNIFIYQLLPYTFKLADLAKIARKKKDSFLEIRPLLQEIYEKFLGSRDEFEKWLNQVDNKNNRKLTNKELLIKALKNPGKNDFKVIASDIVNIIFPESHLSDPTLRKKLNHFKKFYDVVSRTKDSNNQKIKEAFNKLIRHNATFNRIEPNYAGDSLKLIRFFMITIFNLNEIQAFRFTSLMLKLSERVGNNLNTRIIKKLLNDSSKEDRHKNR